jgi:hypothetical protein
MADTLDDVTNRNLDDYMRAASESDAGPKNSFSINVHQYPSDLGSPDILHYIEFAINMRGKSEFLQDKALYEVTRDPDSANMSAEQVSEVAGVGAGAALGVIGGSLASKFVKKFSKTGAGKFIAATAVAGYAAGRAAISANKMLKPDTTFRISDVIALYVDGPPTVKYGMNYANKELGTLAGIVSGGVMESLGVLNPVGEKGAAAMAGFAKLPGAFGAVDVQSALSASSKTSLNPFKEVIFESVDFRTFAFKYKFLPKSKQESQKVKDIIKLFKFHMHPEMSKDKLFFIYPSEFQITYYFESSRNEYFHKMAPCVLEGMDVTYGGDQFSAFKDGNPTEVNISLTFRETEILTKKMIDGGY